MNSHHTALITGATSGLGRVFAQRFAQSGHDLVLTGRRKDKLVHVAEQLKDQFGVSVKVVFAELSNEKDVSALIKLIESHDSIDVLINNAGFGSGKAFYDNTISNHLQMIQVHAMTAIKLVHAVLPQMMNRKKGTIINVSSLSAFTPAPGSSVYSATKLFIKGFSESLHMEVERYGIKVICLCPGFTHTDFHERCSKVYVPKRNGIIRWMEADVVVDECLKSLEKGKIIYIPGLINRSLIRILPLIPGFIYYQLVLNFSRRQVANVSSQMQ